ncbi:MAG: MFS transporter, partial [Ramlibacter sp.]
MELTWTTILPLIFMAVMGLSLLAYVVLDGYDLGVGILLPFATDDEKDVMVSSIGPFWDANETWLVLGVGVLLIAFPRAHSLVLTHLYLPVALMLVGLILRGVSFDFRVKARAAHKGMWNALFATTWGLMQFFCGPVLGMLSDRFGRRPVLLLSLFGLGVDFLFMAFAPTLWWLYVGRILNGMTAASFS